MKLLWTTWQFLNCCNLPDSTDENHCLKCITCYISRLDSKWTLNLQSTDIASCLTLIFLNHFKFGLLVSRKWDYWHKWECVNSLKLNVKLNRSVGGRSVGRSVGQWNWVTQFQEVLELLSSIRRYRELARECPAITCILAEVSMWVIISILTHCQLI
jgi:hypothetical protein